MISQNPRFYIVPRHLYIYSEPYHDCSYKIRPKVFGWRVNWWDWFRAGNYYQGSKKFMIKKSLKIVRSFWLRAGHHKSGWVARSLAKKKGKQI